MKLSAIRIFYGWPTRKMITMATMVILMIYAVALSQLYWPLAMNGFVDGEGRAIGNDFATFWAASRLALDGNAIGVFDHETLFAAERAVLPGAEQIFLWNYPPTYHLVILPLAYLPYVLSFVAFSVAGFAAYVGIIRNLWPDPLAVFTGIAFGAVSLTVVAGQNSLFTMVLLTASMHALISGRQVLGGILIGLLAIKPHLAILIPVALIAAGQWRAFVSAAVTTLGLCAAATVVFGLEYWQMFFANLGHVTDVVIAGDLPLHKIVSIASAMILAGYSSTVAFWMQGAVALISAICVGVVWRRNGPTLTAGAVLIIAACLPSPYFFDYDLAILAGAGLLIVLSGMESGVWLPLERVLLGVWMVLPRSLSLFAESLSLQLAPVFIILLLVYALWRALTLELARSSRQFSLNQGGESAAIIPAE